MSRNHILGRRLTLSGAVLIYVCSAGVLYTIGLDIEDVMTNVGQMEHLLCGKGNFLLKRVVAVWDFKKELIKDIDVVIQPMQCGMNSEIKLC